jgi:hypothetical protein
MSAYAARRAFRYLHDDREPARCQGMMTFTELAPAPSDFLSRSPTGCDWQ